MQSSRNKHWGIFHECVSRSYLAKDAGKLAPQSRALAIGNALSLSGSGDVLAGEAAGDDELPCVGAEPAEGGGTVWVVGAEGANVVPDGHSWPAQGEDAPRVFLELNGADGLDAGEAVGEDSSAGSGEKMQRVNGTVHAIDGYAVVRLERLRSAFSRNRRTPE